jgi:hypothetical protein
MVLLGLLHYGLWPLHKHTGSIPELVRDMLIEPWLIMHPKQVGLVGLSLRKRVVAT